MGQLKQIFVLNLLLVTMTLILRHVTLTNVKKNISHSQALRLIRICSKNDSFDIHCDNLEKLLNERRYSKS